MFDPSLLTLRIKCVRYVLATAAIFVLLATASTSQAQQPLGIAATVNDEMISVLDLESRIALVAGFSGFKNTPETRQRLAPQVIQTLINERLQMQEAKRLGLTAQKGEINAEKAVISRQIKIKPSQLESTLKNNGIDPETLTEQLEAKIVWTKSVRSKFARNATISDEEVDEIIEDIKANKGKPEYLASEIFLSAETPEQATEALKLASRLSQQIIDGANFASIANNFSQSLTAPNGGNLGWNRADKLGAEIKATIEKLGVGNISEPLQTADGIYILLLRAKRLSQGLDGPPPGPAKVTLHQLHLAAPPNSPPNVFDALKSKALALSASAQNCQTFGEISKQQGSPLSGELGTFAIDQISNSMRDLVVNLPVGQPSPPQAIADGVIVLMVCARDIPKAPPVDMKKVRANIRNQLLTAQLTLSARRYIRDLRRTAFIDIRL